MIESKFKNIVHVLIGILVFLITFIISKYIRLFSDLNIENLKYLILSYGHLSAIVFITFYSIKPVVFILPISLLSIAAGNIYGPFIGTALSMIGCFFSATLAFYLSRFFGKSFIYRFIRGKTLKLDSNIEKNGFKIIFFMRLSIVFPYDGLSFAAGLTNMKYSDFIMGTMLGILPEMIAYSLAGKNMGKPLTIEFLFPFIVILFCAMICFYIFKMGKHKTKI